MSGLRYLNTPVEGNANDSDMSQSSAGQDQIRQQTMAKRRAIIHFDLKPANILFDEEGDVKITGMNSAYTVVYYHMDDG